MTLLCYGRESEEDVDIHPMNLERIASEFPAEFFKLFDYEFKMLKDNSIVEFNSTLFHAV